MTEEYWRPKDPEWQWPEEELPWREKALQDIQERMATPDLLDIFAPLQPVEEFGKGIAATLWSPFYKTEAGVPAIKTWTPTRAYGQGALATNYEEWEDPGIEMDLPPWYEMTFGPLGKAYSLATGAERQEAQLGVKGWAEFLPYLMLGGAKKPSMANIYSKQTRGQILTPVERRALEVAKTREKVLYPPESLKPPVDIPREVIVPTAPTKAAAKKEIEQKFIYAVGNSELDVAATKYLRTNRLSEYLGSLPAYEAMTPAEARMLGIATRVTPKGKVVPAVRRTGFSAKQEFVDYKHYKDVGYTSGRWMDTARMYEAIDGGYVGGMSQKYIRWPTERATMASFNFGDTLKVQYRGILEKHGLVGEPKYRKTVRDVMEHISSTEVNPNWWNALLAKSQVSKMMQRYAPSIQKRIIQSAQETRKFFDDLIKQQNTARGRRKQDAIEYRKNYVPYITESNIWSRAFGLKKKPDFMQSPSLPDYIKPDAPFNPRALARQGGMGGYEKERDILRLVYDYIDTASKDIFYTDIVQNAKVHTELLARMGFRNSAKLIDDYVAEAYAGVLPGASRGIRQIVPMEVLRPAFWVRRRLTSAVFPLNWTWNLFIQTSSFALTVMRYGMTSSIKGLDYIFSPAARKWTRNNAYSYIVKQRRAGKVAYQDLGGSIQKNFDLQAGPLEKIEHYANYLTNSLETILNGISVRAAYKDGFKKGLRGRSLLEYASEGASKTQSMYNIEDLPGVLRVREVGAAVPFQTFAFEVFNNVRELGIIGLRRVVGKAGAYETTSASSVAGKAEVGRRVKMLLEWFAAMTAINLTVDMAINRKPWNASSFLPFFATMLGGVNAGNPWNQVIPLRYTGELWGGINNILKYGDWHKLRRWAIRYHVIGGMQIERSLAGLESVIYGGVYDVGGRRLFEVKEDEWLRAIMMGPYQTEQGKDYIDRMQKTKGPLYELFGLPTAPAPKEPKITPRRR